MRCTTEIIVHDYKLIKRRIMLSKSKTLEKFKLRGIDGEIGKVEEFYFDDRHWAIRYLVADTGNWLTGRQVLLSPYSLIAINKEEESISVNLSEKQVEDSPSLETDKPVSRQYENAFFSYYGYPTYWHGEFLWGASPFLLRDNNELVEQQQKKEEQSWDPHMRSTNDVTGHHIEAKDGAIGHVEDFIIDDETWAIRYLIVDTKNWWGGKKVLISPRWIDKISWEESKVYVNLTKEIIKQSPEYSDDLLVTRDYEDQLHQHYKKRRYWTDELPDNLPII